MLSFKCQEKGYFIILVGGLLFAMLLSGLRIRIRIQLPFKYTDPYFIDPPGLYFAPPGLHCERPQPSTAS
jgi:hypothetical protein